MKTKILRSILISVVVVGLLAVVAWRLYGVHAARDAAASRVEAVTVPVSVSPVVVRDIVDRVTVSGGIRARNEADIFTKVPGRVQELLVNVGDQVVAGQVLAVIEHREISLQSDQAAAGVKVAEAGLVRAKVGVDAATAAHARLVSLRDDEAVTRSDLERAEFGLRDAKANVLAAESGVATAWAAAALAAQMVENSRITTPVAGTVTRRLVNVGTAAGQMMPVFQVQDIAVLKMDCSVSASQFARLRVGQDVAVTASDVPDAVFPGKVATLSPSLDMMTRQAAVEIAISNPDGRLMPNMFGGAVIETARKVGVFAVPKVAIVSQSSGNVVFVVRDGRAVQVRPVFGSEDSGFVAVESGLAAGESVIVSGQNTVKDGDAVKVIPDSPDVETAR